MTKKPIKSSSLAQKGYKTQSNKQQILRAGWCHCHVKPTPPKGKDKTLSHYLESLRQDHFTLFGADDQYMAIAHRDSLAVFEVEQFGIEHDKLAPIVEIKTKKKSLRCITADLHNPMALIAADEANKLRLYDFSPDQSHRSIRVIAKEPKVSVVAEKIDGKITRISAGRKNIVVQTQDSGASTRRVYDIHRRTKQVRDLGTVNLDTTPDSLRIKNDEALIARKKGEVRLLVRDDKSADAALRVEALDVPRVSAVAMLNNQHMIVAQKGGQIAKISLTHATANIGKPSVAEICKRIYAILKRCGCVTPCDCECKPKDPCDPCGTGGHDPQDPTRPGGGGTHPTDPQDPTRPGGGTGTGNPGGGIVDDEPCDERHSAKLQWTAKRLVVAGQHVVAFSENNQKMAVMDQSMNVMFERSLGHGAIAVATGQSKTQTLAIYKQRRQQLEIWNLSDYIATLPGHLPTDFIPIPPAPASKITYYGARNPRAQVNPELKVCVFTVTEPGQAYTDPNQNKLFAQMAPNVFDIVNDYYDENSYGDLDVQFSVFGDDFGGTRKPLVLPQPVADYFYDDFTPGGIQAVMPADWADPLVLDGTEELQLHTNPRTGSDKDYDIPFAALWTQETHTSYPVTVDFDGSETLQLTVEDQQGNTHVLDVTFTAQTFTLNQGGNHATFLSDLGDYVTARIRAAEGNLAGDPVTIQNVVFRRIRLNDDNTQFGRLQGQFKIASAAPADAVQKGTIEVTSIPTPVPDALDAIGFSSSGSEFAVLTSRNETRDYLRACLSAAQVDAGEGFGASDPHFDSTVDAVEDAGAQELTVTIKLTSAKGGAGADMEVNSHSGLNASGWNSATPVPGSDSNTNNQNTLRYSVQLADDVFTAAMDYIRSQGPWNAATTQAMFEEFDVMMIGFVGAPPASVLAADRWGTTDPNDFSRLRMFRRTHIASDQNNPNPADPPVSMNTGVVIGQKFSSFSAGVMAHELGHALGLPDLYSASGFRDDVLYIDSWGMMAGGNSNFHHFCGWSKWALSWISEDSDPDISRVVDVPLPEPSGTTATEAWLVPVEYWDNSIRGDVEAVVGDSLPIVQLMKINLGSDGGVINFLELRTNGDTFSQNLSPVPSVIATNVLDPASDRHWAVNGLYRRSVHRLNQGNELQAVGDTWDFASGVEFPLKGCTVEVMEVQSIRGGSIPLFRLRVEREAADYIDLHFQDHVPSWRSPDIWIDWAGDNPDPDVPRVYPEGTPTDQGETVRFPATGTEKHYMVARVHNAGTVRAEDVKVRWFICDPPGAGDDGRWVERDTMTLPEVAAGASEIAPFVWNVDSATNVHQCIRAEIIDWTIPDEVDPSTGDTVHLASDDVKLQNNNAQQNVFDFEALAGSPFDEISFKMQVHNDRVGEERAVLVPDGLPWGAKLEVSPAEAVIPSGKSQTFACKLSVNDAVIKPGCNNDRGFLLTAWRRAEDSDEKWGSCFYFIRPRYKTQVVIESGYWVYSRMRLSGQWSLATTDDIDISSEKPLYVRLRIEIDGDNNNVHWFTLPVDNNGYFNLELQDGIADEGGKVFSAQVWFDRTQLLGSSISEVREYKRQFIG